MSEQHRPVPRGDLALPRDGGRTGKDKDTGMIETQAPVGTVRQLPRFGRILLQSLRAEGVGFVGLWPFVASTVPGWCTGPDARQLYAFAHHGPGAGAIVEIGSAWGRSTVFLARGSKQAGREPVHAIDPHTGDPTYREGDSPRPPHLDTPAYRGADASARGSLIGFRHTLRRFRVDDWVIPVVATSTAAAKTLDTRPIRLLFIDGLHSYEGVSADIADWVPRVIPGGIIVFDDYFSDGEGYGVKRAVDALIASGAVGPIQGRGIQHIWLKKR